MPEGIALSRDVLEERSGGEGSGTQKFVYRNGPYQYFFLQIASFPTMKSGSGWGVAPLLLWLSAIPIHLWL